MVTRTTATVTDVSDSSPGAVVVTTEYGLAIAYLAIVGAVNVGDRVLLNRTATTLHLGTGGFDFVMAVISCDETDAECSSGHIMKLRYSPSQLAVDTLEEDKDLFAVWDKTLEEAPVVVCQLHSQIAHVAASVSSLGKRAVYIMTDTAGLAYPFSNLAAVLKKSRLISASITSGQAFGGDYETVTVHSALLAAKHYLGADVIIVCQGPGNAGTGTTYGFSGIDQASLLDTVSALGGEPVAALRVSESDPRTRHRGISHHSITALRLVRSACTIPVPAGMITTGLDVRHRIVEVSNLLDSFNLLDHWDIRVTTMGRATDSDRQFFEAAAAAGKYAADRGDN
jgi:hypothetical protein